MCLSGILWYDDSVQGVYLPVPLSNAYASSAAMVVSQAISEVVAWGSGLSVEQFRNQDPL